MNLTALKRRWWQQGAAAALEETRRYAASFPDPTREAICHPHEDPNGDYGTQEAHEAAGMSGSLARGTEGQPRFRVAMVMLHAWRRGWSAVVDTADHGALAPETTVADLPCPHREEMDPKTIARAASIALDRFVVDFLRFDSAPTAYCAARTVPEWVEAAAKDPSVLHEKCDANVLVAQAMVAAGIYATEEAIPSQDVDPWNATFEGIKGAAVRWLAPVPATVYLGAPPSICRMIREGHPDLDVSCIRERMPPQTDAVEVRYLASADPEGFITLTYKQGGTTLTVEAF